MCTYWTDGGVDDHCPAVTGSLRLEREPQREREPQKYIQQTNLLKDIPIANYKTIKEIC